jgi:hypothetical protein
MKAAFRALDASGSPAPPPLENMHSIFAINWLLGASIVSTLRVFAEYFRRSALALPINLLSHALSPTRLEAKATSSVIGNFHTAASPSTRDREKLACSPSTT